MNFSNCVIWESQASTHLFDNYNPILTGFWLFLDYCILNLLGEAERFNYSQALGDSTFIGEYPDFVDTSAGDFRLKICSPAMDRGDNQATLNAGLLTDLDGNPRIRFAQVDIGAYETQDSCFTISSTEPQTTSFTASLSPNPAVPGGLLEVQVTGLEEQKAEWVVRDALGREVSAGRDENRRFSVIAPACSGIYFIEIRAGHRVVWLKFIVEA